MRMQNKSNEQNRKEKMQEKKLYQAPAVIFENEITTRAGSPTGLDPNGIDPSDLFD